MLLTNTFHFQDLLQLKFLEEILIVPQQGALAVGA